MDNRAVCILRQVDGKVIPVLRPTFLKRFQGEYIIRCEVLMELRSEMVMILNEIAQRQQLKLWPPEDADDWCWESIGQYYRAIAELLTPSFDPGLLRPDDRHRFFVCTEPIENNGRERLGLSNMERLMGCQEAEDVPEQGDMAQVEKIEGIPSTGKRHLDILADVTLFFQKKTVIDICLALSPEELLRLTERAASSLYQAHKEAERRSKGETDADEIPIREEISAASIVDEGIKKESLPEWLQEDFD